MASQQQHLARAWQHQQAGEIGQAEALCQQIVRKDPYHAEAWNLLGILASQSGKAEAGLGYFDRARKAAPRVASYRSNRGAVLQNMGRLPEAEAEYREALKLNPKHPESHYNLGKVLELQGRTAEAEASYRRALELKPAFPEALNNRGAVLKALGRLDEAAACYRRALELVPDFLEALSNLGALLTNQEKGAEAVPLLERAVQLNPNFGEAHYNLATALRSLGRTEEPLVHLRRAAELCPLHADTLKDLGYLLWKHDHLEESAAVYGRLLELKPVDADLHNNRATVLENLHRFAEAESECRRALELKPEYPEASNILGAVLRGLGRLEESAAACQRALALQPDYADAHNNLGNVLRDLGRFEESEASYREALKHRADFPEACNNLGAALRSLGRLAESEANYRRALEMQPHNPEFHNNLGLLILTTGDYSRGWPEYEWRYRIKGCELPAVPQPLWDGGPLDGKTILLHHEQGLGDALQFIRYAIPLKERGATVMFQGPRRLVSILRTCTAVDEIIADGAEPAPFEVRTPLLSLPYRFGTTAEAIPAPVPYLAAEPELVKTWQARMETPGFKVGIVWQGNPKYIRDKQRSIALKQFECLARITNVALFSLQVDTGREQLSSESRLLVDLGSRFDASSFSDAAAAIKNLDLLITVDTALAHLAGALAAPVWVLLPFASDWRWLTGREDSPWYPTMRLFRQQRLDEWDEVLERVTQALTTAAKVK